MPKTYSKVKKYSNFWMPKTCTVLNIFQQKSFYKTQKHL